MPRLTNMYYAQYESTVESDPAYDSDNLDSYKRLMESPSQVSFRQVLERRQEEEEYHELWKQHLYSDADFKKNIEKQCGIIVNLADDQVNYIYKPVNTGTRISGIRFRLTFVYVKLLRKWYISLGRSRLPDTIDLRDVMEKGVYDPTEPKVVKLIRNVRTSLDTYVKRYIYIFEVVDTMEEAYKDMEFHVDQSLVSMKVSLKEKAWPNGLNKISYKDIITMKLTLDDNIKIDNLEYDYEYSGKLSVQQEKEIKSKLDDKLKPFFDYPLMVAFEIFMKGDCIPENTF